MISNKSYEKRCPECLKVFHALRKDKVYCSEKCQKKFYARIYKLKHCSPERKLKKATCRFCKGVFQKRTHNQQTCSKICRDKYLDQNPPKSKMGYYKLRFEIFKRDNFTCQYCGRNQLDDGIKIHVDHIKPRICEGEHRKENYVVACEECNLGKSDVLLKKHQEEKYLRYTAKEATE